MVWGEGDPEAPIIIILEHVKIVWMSLFFVEHGKTLQEVANEAGLKLNDLYITFILKRIPVRAYDKELVRST